MHADILKILQSIAPESDFAASRDFLADGLLDSFDVILVTTALEEAFRVAIPGELISPENFSSLDSLATLVQGAPAAQP